MGRLDMDSEGLIIVTNDGELTHRLTHPSYGVPKEYLVQVEGEPSPGRSAGSARGWSSRTARRRPPGWRSWPRRSCGWSSTRVATARSAGMCDAVGHPVVRLVRTRIGPLADPSLSPGSYRPLTFDEVRGLAAAAVAADGTRTPAARAHVTGPLRRGTGRPLANMPA